MENFKDNQVFYDEWEEYLTPETEKCNDNPESKKAIYLSGGHKVWLTRNEAKRLIANLIPFAYPPEVPALKISTDAKD